jgi:hypothetical protein
MRWLTLRRARLQWLVQPDEINLQTRAGLHSSAHAAARLRRQVLAQLGGRRRDQLAQLCQRRRARLDRAGPHHAQLANRFHAAGGVFRDPGRLAREHLPGRTFGIQCIGFATLATERTVDLIDFEDVHPGTQ